MDYYRLFFPSDSDSNSFKDSLKDKCNFDFDLYRKSFADKNTIEEHRSTLQHLFNSLFGECFYLLFNSKETPASTSPFCINGIEIALDKIEKDSRCYFINKYAIIRILYTFLLTKDAIIFLDLNQFKPSDLAAIPFNKRDRYHELVLSEAKTYFEKKSFSYLQFNPTKSTIKQNAEQAYYSTFSNHFNEAEKICKRSFDGYGSEKLMEAFEDFNRFRKETLSLVYNYIITKEEFEQKKGLFDHTWHKKLLIYDLLTQLDLELKLPITQTEYQRLTEIGTKNFNDFKRDKVNSYFGA